MFQTDPLRVAELQVRTSRHRFVPYDTWMAPGGQWERHRLILGSERNAYDRCHHRAIYDEADRPFPPQVMVRPYLANLVDTQGPEANPIHDDQLLERVPPLYFDGPASSDLAVVDLHAAYWSLYRTVTLDLAYDGVTAPRVGRVRLLGAEELEPHKLLRNAIVGTIRATDRTESTYGAIANVPVGPRWRRPALWAWIMDTLEAVAWEARMGYGAVSVHIDGYIVPSGAAGDLVGYLWSEWGLRADIVTSGPGVVTGLGHWRIGDVVRGYPEPVRGGYERVDNMARRGWFGLHDWYVDALAAWNERNLTTTA